MIKLLSLGRYAKCLINPHVDVTIFLIWSFASRQVASVSCVPIYLTHIGY